MIKNLKKRQEGFTIIEVMIVLVIAAVILLIVFLAVPALQRNSRNTQRKNDAAGVLGAVNEYITNNSGALPGQLTLAGGTVTAACSGNNCTGTPATGKVGFITTVNLSAYANNLAVPNADTVTIVTNATCNGNTIAAGTSTRQLAAYFGIEPNGTQCVQS